MKRVKAAFDPHGILNPGKIFPEPGAAGLLRQGPEDRVRPAVAA